MISENQKLRVCARIRDELPAAFGRLFLEEMEQELNESIPTTCAWKESFQFRWELYFYIFLANRGYEFNLFRPFGPPMRCHYHPWYTGLIVQEFVILANVVGRVEEIVLNMEEDQDAVNDRMNDILMQYRSYLMEWHDEEAAREEIEEIKRSQARRLRDQLNEYLGEGGDKDE